MHHQIIILAAGNGSRMNSSLPKPMHLVNDAPMLATIIASAKKFTPDVVLLYSAALANYLANYRDCTFVLQQEPPLGTAHAVFCALQKLDPAKYSTVLYADHPFIDHQIIADVAKQITLGKYDCATLASIQQEPNNYGRLICNGQDVSKIVEFKNLTLEQQKITLCNSAVMSFAPGILHQFLPMLMQQDRDQGEFYLTEMVELLAQHNKKTSYVIDHQRKSSIGVNTQSELTKVNELKV